MFNRTQLYLFYFSLKYLKKCLAYFVENVIFYKIGVLVFLKIFSSSLKKDNK